MKWFVKLIIEVLIFGIVLAVLVYFVINWLSEKIPAGGGGSGV
jgi:hypothetical protein